ncbi:MAG: hypothetical protein J0G28_14350 [Afipia sp.]|nr:hypothetical protein [Afipia sp.]OJW65481.1 MAG: hypothetical protein BGO65_12185 [Afipia sp. 64-13]
MTNYQSNTNARIAYCVQANLGARAASNGAAKVLRSAGGPGAKLSKASTVSNEIRKDGLSVRGRHGIQKTTGDYAAELSLGSHDPIIEAIMRGTWNAVPLELDAADFTSMTTTAHTIVLTMGNPIALGIRNGNIIRLSGAATAANNGRNLRVTGLSANTITVAETLTVDAVADVGATIIRPGKILSNPANRIARYFTVEEYEGDIDQSTLLTDFVWGSAKLTMAPNGILTLDPGGVGTGRLEALPPAESPYFDAPVETTGAPMAVVDATIRFRDEDLVELTSLDLTMDIQPSAPDTFGSGAIKYAPDVFPGSLQVSANITMLRKSLDVLSDFIDETQLQLHILAVDNEAEPKDFMSIVVPNLTLGGVDPSALSKQGGGRTQTIQIPPALVGIDTSATGNNSMIEFQTTAA